MRLMERDLVDELFKLAASVGALEQHDQSKGEALAQALSAYTEDELKLIQDFFQKVDAPNAHDGEAHGSSE